MKKLKLKQVFDEKLENERNDLSVISNIFLEGQYFFQEGEKAFQLSMRYLYLASLAGHEDAIKVLSAFYLLIIQLNYPSFKGLENAFTSFSIAPEASGQSVSALKKYQLAREELVEAKQLFFKAAVYDHAKAGVIAFELEWISERPLLDTSDKLAESKRKSYKSNRFTSTEEKQKYTKSLMERAKELKHLNGQIILWEEAAQLGDSSAQFKLAEYYIDIKNPLAIQYLKYAVEQHLMNAFLTLGECYEFGIQTPKNLQFAVKYYKQVLLFNIIRQSQVLKERCLINLKRCYTFYPSIKTQFSEDYSDMDFSTKKIQEVEKSIRNYYYTYPQSQFRFLSSKTHKLEDDKDNTELFSLISLLTMNT